MTVGGMVKALALVEDGWFSYKFRNRDRQPPWDTMDWDADPDWDWHSAAGDSPEQLIQLWQDAVDRSRAVVSEPLASGGLDQLAQPAPPDGRAPSLRWLLCHMIDEYARHNCPPDL